MITTTPMGPGFFIFFQTETIESGGYEPRFADYGTTAEKRRFKPVGKEQRKAKRVIEQIADRILETPKIETDSEIELILRLKLEQEGLVYKALYLKWLIQQAEIERKHKAALILLLLH